MASTRLLADAPEVIPTIANWYRGEWEEWFTHTSREEIEADVASTAYADRLPVGLVAFDAANQPIGFCSLRADPFEPYPHAGPWLRGLYVDIAQRGQGVAGLLIRAAKRQASTLRIPKLYAATHSAISTFERAGWLGFDQTIHDQQTLTIFAKRTV